MKSKSSKKNLMKRVITAVLLISIILSIIYLLPFYFFKSSLFILIAIAAYEWGYLSFLPNTNHSKKLYVIQNIFYVITIIFCCFLSDFIPFVLLFGLSGLFWLTITGLVIIYPRYSDFFRKFQFARAIAGIVVLIPFYQSILQIRLGNIHFFTSHNSNEILIVLILVWVMDIAAYFIGRAYGKHLLAPQISPGKTIAGAWGGTVSALIIASLIFFLNYSYSLSHLLSFLLMAFILANTAILGDLFESLMKRLRGVKDSSNLLPGHGGLLDRIDSALAVFPIFALLAIIFRHTL